jgi:hypothetical protein
MKKYLSANAAIINNSPFERALAKLVWQEADSS